MDGLLVGKFDGADEGVCVGGVVGMEVTGDGVGE